MRMSYRRAWLLVDEMNKLFDTPVVAKWQGGKSKGGASLTAFGEKLVASYDVLRSNANKVNRALLAELGRSAGRGRRVSALKTKRSR
jgi:molybdate transport system regulatory protein